MLQWEVLQHQPDSSHSLILCTWEQAQVLLLFHLCFIVALPSQSMSNPACFLAWHVSSPDSWQGLLILLLQTSLSKATFRLAIPSCLLFARSNFIFFFSPSKPLRSPFPPSSPALSGWAECPAPAGTPCLLPFSPPLWTMQYLCWNDPQDHPSFLIQDLQGIHLAYSIHQRCLFIKIKL